MRFFSLILSIIVLCCGACKKDMEITLPDASNFYDKSQVDAILRNFTCVKGIPIEKPEDEITLNQFFNDFPEAYEVEWALKSNFYKADFKINHVEYKAIYDKNGLLVASMMTIEKSQLSSNVSASIKEHYGKAWYISAIFFVKAAYNTELYRVELLKDNNDIILSFFDLEGLFVTDCS